MSLRTRQVLKPFKPFLLVLLLICPIVSNQTNAEQLPVKTYTIADGLARDYINRIRQDSRGFIWFCTTEGLSRFDGYGFTNYGVADGLPHRVINDCLETRDGAYLFATSGGGLVEFDPANTNSDGSHFTIVTLGQSELSRVVLTLIEDEAGTIWCGTVGGVFRLTRAANGWQSSLFRPASSKEDFVPVANTITFDRHGSLWIGTGGSGLYCCLPDGDVEHYTTQNGLAQNGISKLLLDRDGRMWVGTGEGLTLLVSDPRPNERIAARVYTTKDGLSYNFINALFQSSDGRLWVGTRGGLSYLVDADANRGSGGLPFRSYTTAEGLRNIGILDITEDRDHNLWLGAESGGAMKIPLGGFISYFETDGLGNGRISQLFSDHNGNVYVVANVVESLAPVIARFDGHAFVKENPNLPPGTELTWGWNNLIAQDKKGDWWIPTAQGIYRFSGNKSLSELVTAPPTKVYTVKDGMDVNPVFRLFEDARGDIWFGTLGVPPAPDSPLHPLHRWDRGLDKIQYYTPRDSDVPQATPTAFVNDGGGNLWIGFYIGGVSRYANGHFTHFTEKDGMPAGFIRDLLVDRKQRLWIATSNGLSRVDDPMANRPQFVNYTTKDGLTSDQVTTVTEDRWGQIYVGTGRGLDRLDPDSGKVKHYTTADGLADNFVNVSMRDAQGALWFGTLRGLSRFIPERDRPLSPPTILVSGLTVAGIRQRIPELGETEINIPELNYRQNQVQIDFVSITYAPGDVLRYQYMLAGTDKDWSASTEHRSITLASLGPGNYRFLVRAVNSDGVASTRPASVTFSIVAPIWRRWWFRGLAAILVLSVAFVIVRQRWAGRREREQAEAALRRAREERLRELEEVRRRIATDLHDDVGSSLTQVSLLTEVARQAMDGSNEFANQQLSIVAAMSRDLVDSMSDIVWAINPKKDKLDDLINRMRHFASDVFTAQQIEFEFRAPEDDQEIKVGANVRRELYLIFKEGVNNIVRHAGCTKASVELQFVGDQLSLRMADNGRGFDLSQERTGNGLSRMTERAKAFGGHIEIASIQGSGTTIEVSIPLKLHLERFDLNL